MLVLAKLLVDPAGGASRSSFPKAFPFSLTDLPEDGKNEIMFSPMAMRKRNTWHLCLWKFRGEKHSLLGKRSHFEPSSGLGDGLTSPAVSGEQLKCNRSTIKDRNNLFPPSKDRLRLVLFQPLLGHLDVLYVQCMTNEPGDSSPRAVPSILPPQA